MNKQGKSEMVVLKEFVGLKDGQTLKDFMAEVRQLSDAEKHELAVGAVKELGLSQDQLSFSI